MTASRAPCRNRSRGGVAHARSDLSGTSVRPVISQPAASHDQYGGRQPVRSVSVSWAGCRLPAAAFFGGWRHETRELRFEERAAQRDSSNPTTRAAPRQSSYTAES